MVGLGGRLELSRGALMVALVGAFPAAAADIEAVAMRRADGAFSYEEGIAAVRDMSASPVVRSLPVPLMERRALLAGTEEGRGSVRGATGVQKQRKRGQHKESGTRGGSKGTSSSSSVRHPLCKQIDISASYLSASETTQSGHPPENVIDGDLDTRWATEGLASWLMVDLPETTALQGVAVAFARNSEGSRDDSQSFTMLVLGDNQVIHRPEVNAEATGGLEYFGFERDILAKSVVFVGYGREGHTSLAEMKLCGAQAGEAPAPSPEELADDSDGDSDQRTNRRENMNLRGSRSDLDRKVQQLLL